MKNLLLLLLVASIFCQCESVIDSCEEPYNSIDENDIVYPLSDVRTRSYDDFGTDWEDIEQVQLPSGTIVNTPWNTNYSSSSIPSEYRTDIKKADGWNIIAHTMSGNEVGLNYIFFYNKYSGLLKVFYYLEGNFSQTTGLWHVHIDRPQSILAFAEDFARPIDSSETIQDVYCSNITINENKSFTAGWNCFQLELAYDPNFTEGYLQVEPCAIVMSQLSIGGNFSSSSSGSIVSLNNTKKGFLSATASAAKNYAISEAPKVINNLTKGITLNGVSNSTSVLELIKKGLPKIVKSLLSVTKSQTPNEYSLQFATNGNVSLEGDISTSLGGGFSPITLNISNNRVGKLGIWNIINQPVIQFNTLGRRISVTNNSFPVFRIYGAGKNIYHTIYNSCDLDSISTTYDIFTGNNSGYCEDGGNLSGGMFYSGMGEKIYDGLYNQKAVEFKVYFPGIDNHSVQQVPNMIYLYGSRSEYCHFGIANNYIFKVVCTITVGDKYITSSKSYIPKLEWRTDNLQLNQNSVEEESNLNFILQRY